MNTERRAMHLLRAMAAGIALISTFAWGYAYIFSRFSWYDDEGYVMISVRQVAEGRALYDDVFSQYGPFYYVTRLALLTVLQAPVSHDVTRLITLTTWIAIAGLLGTYLVRMSGSAFVAIVGYLLLFHHLRPLAHEPGHPQELGLLLIAGLVTLAAWWNGRRQAPSLMVAAGVVVGGLVLTKINVGLYAAPALAVTIATFASTPSRTLLLAVLALASAVLPWAVMREHTNRWAFGYAALVSLSSMAVAVTCRGVSTDRPLGAAAIWRVGLAGAVTLVATCLAIVARGTSATGLLNGVVLQPLAFAGTFSTEVRVANPAVVVTAVSLALAVAYGMTHRARESRPTTGAWLFWWLKLAAGLLGLVLALTSPHALLGAGPALLWLVLIRPLSASWQYEELVPRVTLVTLASLQTLQAYPVAGSQVACATFLLIPAMVLCAADAIADLSTTRAGYLMKEALSARSLLETVALVGVLLVYEAQANIVGARQQYHALPPLSLPGALRVRLSADEVERYQWLVRHVQQYCGTLITLPGLNSLYFWTDLEPPTGLNTTAWPVLLDREQQQRIVDVVRSRQNVCIVENPAGIGRDGVVTQQPLMRFVRDEFHVVEERGGYRILSRHAAARTGSP